MISWTTRDDHRVAVLLAAGTFAYFLLIAGGHHYSIDGILAFQAAKSLLFQGSLVLDPPVRWGDDLAVGRWGIGTVLAGVASLLVVSPAFAAAPGLQATPYDPSLAYNPELYSNTAYLLTCWMNPLLTAATCAVVFVLARRVGLTPRWSAAAALAYGLASPAAAYSRYDFPQPLAAFLVTSMVTMLLIASPGFGREVPERREPWRSPQLAVAGILFGCLLLVRIELLALLPWVLVWMLAVGGVRPLANRLRAGMLVAMPVAAAVLVHRHVEAIKASGVSPFASASSFAGQLAEWFRFGPAELAEGIVGVLISPGRGLLVFFPLAWLAIGGLSAPSLRRGGANLLFLGLLIVPTVLYGAFVMWWAGICWGPRFHVTFLPLLSVAAAAWASSVGPHPWRRRRIYLALAALGLIVSLNGILMDPNDYYARAAGRFRFVPDAPDTQFQLRSSPLATGWLFMSRSHLDLLWLRVGQPDTFAPASRLLSGASRETGVEFVQHAHLISLAVVAMLIGVMLLAGRRAATLLPCGTHSPPGL